MGSLSRQYSEAKRTGRVYTPDWLVCRILDAAGYTGSRIAQSTILDPACGDGQFLVDIVQRILDTVPADRQLETLRRVHGWDTDAEAVSACRERLDALLAPHGLAVNWKVQVRNSLKAKGTCRSRFDFIVGNPPYVRIQHLSAADRELVQTRFQFCKSGSTDLYIAFFELALSLLAPEGTVAFVTPNTYFHTVTGRALRAHFASGHRLRQLVNFGHRQIFPNATTYAAISVASNEPAERFMYIDASEDTESTLLVEARQLHTHRAWRFGTGTEHLDPERYRPLREIADIHVGLATLADWAYIVQAIPEESGEADKIRVQTKASETVEIERGLLRPIIKGSKVKHGEPCHQGAYIVFPYQRDGSRPRLIPEPELAERYPLGYAYLLRSRQRLEKRDNGKPNPYGWYAFGRAQALTTSFGEKIICPPMAKEPTFVVCRQAETTVYAGYVVKYDGDLDALAKQLNSARMEQWVRSGGRDYVGGWKGYSKTSFQDFPIDVTQV